MNMNEQLRGVIDEMRGVKERLDELLDAEELTDDERAEHDKLSTDFDGLNETRLELIERIEKHNRIEEALRDQRNVIETTPRLDDDPLGEPNSIGHRGRDSFEFDERFAPAGELRARALSAVEQLDAMNDDKRAHLTAMIEDDLDGGISRHVLVAGHPDYVSAFEAHLRGRPYSADEQKAVTRAMSLTTTAGGFLIPTPLDPTLILTNAGTVNPFRQVSRVVQITSNTWNGVSSAGVTASWDAEAAEVSDDTPTLAQPTITAYKGAAFVPVSIEAAQDIANLSGIVSRLVADAKDRLEGTAFATGSGSAQPFGVVTAVAAVTASRVSATTNNAFGLVDVYKTHEALPARWEDSATWIANKAIVNDIRQFGTANNYSGFLVDLAPSSTGRFSRTLLGSPLYTSSAMDGAIATGDDDILIYGDFSHYVIADRIGLSVEGIPHLFHTSNNRPSGQRGFYAHWRVGADVIVDDAFRVLRV